MVSPQTSQLEAGAAYVEKHKVYQLFEGLLADLIVSKPADPIAHMISALKTPPVAKVIVTGPPSSDTRSQCELISSRLGLVHVDASDVWRDAAKAGTEAGLKAKALVDNGEEVPDALMLELLKEKFDSEECASKGWVLEGFPTTAAQTRAMLSAGLLPTKVLLLQLDDEEVRRRLTGRRVDPVENAVYHLEDAPAPDAETASRLVQRPDDTEEKVVARLAAYRRIAAEVLPYFPKVLLELDAGLPKEVLYTALLPSITPEMPSRAPRGSARVMLLGGPGSRAEELGEALTAAYGAVLVSAPQLLRAAALSGTVHGMKVKPYLDKGELAMVPDKLVRGIVLARLQHDDCRQFGFILQGFPSTTQQASWLTKHGVWIRHCVLLDLDNATAKRRITQSKVDPVDGTSYHPDLPGYPTDPAVQARLLPALHSGDKLAKKALHHWRERGMPLADKTYKEQLMTIDDTLPLVTAVEMLAGCFMVKA